MAAITVHPLTRTRPATTPVRATDQAAPAVVEPRPDAELPGPDERTLARTTVVVVASLALLIGTLLAAAYGVGVLASAATSWFLG